MNVNGIPASMIGAMVLLAANGFADTPGRHPAYLHARTDLRRAERLMGVREQPNVMRELAAAARETREAIREMDEAALWDRKDQLTIRPWIRTPTGPGGSAQSRNSCSPHGETLIAKKTIRPHVLGGTGRFITSMSRYA